MASSIPAPPASLKALLPFIQRSQELRQASPPMAYWALYHALQQGIPSLSSKADPEAKKYLLTLMDTTEALKRELVDKGYKEVQSDEEARVFVRGFAEKVFGGADKEDREGKATRSTAKAFLAASNFIQILRDLEEGNKLDDEMSSKLKYSKWKAADIAKALREGRKPTAGPAGSDVDPTLLDPAAGLVAGAAEGEPSLALPESKEEKEYVEREMKKLMEGASLEGDEGPGTPTPAPATGEDEGVVHAISPAVAAPDSPSAARRMQSRLSYDGSLQSRTSSTGAEPVAAASSKLGPTSPGGIGEERGKSPNFSMPLHPQLGIITGGEGGGGGDGGALESQAAPSSSSSAPPPSAGASSAHETDEGSMWRKDMPTPVQENATSASGFDAYTTRVLPSNGGLGPLFAAPGAAQGGVGAALGLAPPAPIPSPGSRPLPTPGLSPSLGTGTIASGFQTTPGTTPGGSRGLPIPPGETAPGSGPIPPPWAASVAGGGAPMAPSLSNTGSATSSTPSLGLGLGAAPTAPPGSGFLSHPHSATPSAPPFVSPPAPPPPSVPAPPAAGASSPFLAPSAPPLPSPSAPAAAVAAAPASQPPPAAPVPLPTSLPAASIARAQKLGRWAVSALDYEDLDTARKHLRTALDIVEGREVKESDAPAKAK